MNFDRLLLIYILTDCDQLCKYNQPNQAIDSKTVEFKVDTKSNTYIKMQ